MMLNNHTFLFSDPAITHCEESLLSYLSSTSESFFTDYNHRQWVN